MSGRRWGARWPTVPGPWNAAPYNLPAPMQTLPMELVRSKLYPPQAPTTREGVMKQAAGGFRPGFLFPWKGGSRAHAPNAARAVVQARMRLDELKAAALDMIGVPPHPQGVSAPPYPMATARMWPDPPPGVGVREVPFAPQTGAPPAAVLRMQERLEKDPGSFSAGSPKIGLSPVAAKLAAERGRIVGFPLSYDRNVDRRRR